MQNIHLRQRPPQVTDLRGFGLRINLNPYDYGRTLISESMTTH